MPLETKDFSETERLCNRSRAPEGGGEESVGAVPVRPQAQALAGVESDALRREQLGAGERLEFRVRGAERVGHVLVFLLQNAAGCVHQSSARPDELRGGLQDALLLLSKLGDRPRSVAPLQVRIAPQRAEAAAGRIDQNAV